VTGLGEIALVILVIAAAGAYLIRRAIRRLRRRSCAGCDCGGTPAPRLIQTIRPDSRERPGN